MSQRTELAKQFYRAFETSNRDFAEAALAADFKFSAPPDPLLDRRGFFERCWPGAGSVRDFRFIRLVEDKDEVIVTYEATMPDGKTGRNAEVLTFRDTKIVRAEVYFGWIVG